MVRKRRRIALWVLVLLVASALTAQNRPDALELYRQGRYERAIEVTLAEIEENPANMNAYTVLGWSLLQLDRFEDALFYGEQGLGISRYDNRVIQIVAEAHYFLGNDLQALDKFQEYVAVAPTGNLIGQVYYFMGEILLRMGEYHHADIALTTAVFHESDRVRWWSRLGYAREMAGEPAYAAEAYRNALALDANFIEAQRGLGRVQGDA